MSESISFGGRRVAGFSLGDLGGANPFPRIARSAATGAVLGGVVGSLVDYSRTGGIGWGMPATFAAVGAVGGGLLGAI